MPYVGSRIVHDADAHIMEAPGWLDPFLDAGLAERMGPSDFLGVDGRVEERFLDSTTPTWST